MFGLGFWEIALILAVALLVLGPSKLPDLAKSLGKGLREFRKATDDLKTTIQDEAYRPDEMPRQPPKPSVPELPPPPEPSVPAQPAAPVETEPKREG